MESPKTKATRTTGFGRVTNFVNYQESPTKQYRSTHKHNKGSKSSSTSSSNSSNGNNINNNNPRATVIVLQETKWNLLHNATERGEKFHHISPNTRYLLGINRIKKVNNDIFITGAFLTRSGDDIATITKRINANAIPAAFLIGVVKNIKNMDERIDVSNDLYKRLTKKFQLPKNYLKYKFNESVLYKSEQSFDNNGAPINNPTQTATITRLLPHLHVGDDTAEYEIKIDHSGELVRTGEYCLRPVSFVACATIGDIFDTSFSGWAVYEHDRANELKIFSYAKYCDSAVGAASLSFYQRADTAYFNKKKEFYALAADSLKSASILLTMGKYALKSVLFNAIKEWKPQAHNIQIKINNVGKKSAVSKIGDKVECNIVQALINDIAPTDETEEKENTICEYDEKTFWFSFDSMGSLCNSIGIHENDTKIVNGLDTMKLVLSNDNCLVFAWIRDIKLLTIESCTYVTSHASKSMDSNNKGNQANVAS